MVSKMKLSLNSNTDINKYMNLESENSIKFSEQKNSKDNHCILETMNNLNKINRIFNNKYKAFEALENLILNDNDNNKEIKRLRLKSKTNEIFINRDRNKTPGQYLKTEKISIPKLDFTRIYKRYSNQKILIKEIVIMSDDEKNEKIMHKIGKIDIQNGHHHHKHHHKKKTEILQNRDSTLIYKCL